MIETACTIGLAIVSLAAVLIMIKLLTSRNLADKMVALDALLIAVVGGIALQSARTGDDTYLNVMVVTALLALVGATLVARFITKRGN